MQKNFTKLIAHFLSAKRYTVPAGVLLLFLSTSLYVWATIFPAVVNLTATVDQAANASSPSFVSVGNVVIKEEGTNDFNPDNLVIRAQGNWRFDPNSVNTVALRSSGGNIASSTTVRPSISTDFKTLTFTIVYSNRNSSGSGSKEDITISGMQVQPIDGAVALPSTGSVVLAANTNVVGLGSDKTVADLTMKYGAAKSLAFTQQPSTVAVGAAITPGPQVAVKDQFGNTVIDASGSFSVALTGTPSTALITSGGTATVTNGVAQFDNIRIDEGGNFQLVAKYGSSVQGTSNSFVVNNPTPSNISSPTCITAGGEVSTVSVLGENFVRGSVVQIAYPDAPTVFVNKPTTFVNTGALTADLAGDIATARTLRLRVLNPTPQGGASAAIDFVIRPVLTAGPITGPAAVCANSPTPYTYSIDAIAEAISYNWEFPTGVTVTGTSTGSSVQVSFGANAPAEVTISVAPRNACGVLGTAATYKVNVNQYPTSVDAGANRNICLGETTTLGSGQPAVAGYTYSWSPTTGLSDASSPNPTVTLGNTTATIQTYTYTLSVTNGQAACEVQDQVTVNVYPEFIVEAGHVQPVCVGEVLNLTATGDDSYTYKWTGPNGFTSGLRNPSIQNVTAANAGTYQVEVTNLNTCVATASTTVQVVDKPTANAGADQSKCATGNSTSFNLTGSTSEGAGIWSVVAGTATITNETSLTTAVAVTSGSATLRLTAENAAGCVFTDDVVLTVNPLPVAVIEQGTVTYFCRSGGTARLSAQTGTGYSYAWYRVATEGEANDVLVDNDTNPSNNQAIEVSNVGDYYVVVTDGNTCVSTSGRIAVQSVVVNNNLLSSADQEICYGAAPAAITGDPASPSEPGATLTYQWQESADGTTYTNISGANDVKLELGPLTATTIYRRLAIVGSCADESAPVKITVLPQIINTLTSANQTICQNGSVQIITGNAPTGGYGSGSYTYTWYQRTGNGTWGIAPGTNTGESYTPQVSATPGTYSFRRDVKSGSCDPVESNLVTVTVLPSISGNTISGTQAYCQGATATALSTNGTLSGGTGSYTYLWQQSTTNTTTSTWANAAGAYTDANYTPSTATAGTMYYRRVVNSGDCSSTSDPLAVTVNLQPSVTASAPVSARCVGANNTTSFELTGTATNGSPSWSYVSSTGSITQAGTSFSSPTTGNTQVTVTGEGSVVVRLTSSGAAAGCNDATKDITLTVKPFPTVNAGPDQEVCAGTTSTRFNRVASGSGSEANNEVAWTVKSTTEGVTVSNLAYPFLYNSFVDITGVGSAVLTLAVTTNGCTTYDEVTYTVKPVPTVNAVESKTYCNGESGSAISFGSSVSGASFAWTSSTDVGFGTIGSGNIPTFTATNTGTAPVTATVKVKATLNDCTGPEQSFTVRVNPTPKLSSSLGPLSTCSNTLFTYTPTSATSGAIFTWTRAGVPGISNGAELTPVSGGVSETLINTTASPINVTYRYTTTANGCTGPTQDVVVTVNPNLPVAFTGTIANTNTFYTGQSAVALSAEPTGGVFSSPTSGAVTLSGGVYYFNPCAAKAGTHTITYTRTTGSCRSTVSKTVTVIQSTYRAVITANPHPFCRGGGGTTYTAAVYRDVQPGEIIYPYLVDANGNPVDAANNPIPKGGGNYPVPNPDYPYPAGTPESIKAMSFRFFQPKVSDALDARKIDPSLFNYQWGKNDAVDRKNDTYITKDAGLSSQDYYEVDVTSKSGALCTSVSLESNRMYSAVLENYTVALSAAPNPICQGASVTFTATLGAGFPWDIANLQLDFVLERGNVVLNPTSFTYTGSNTITFTTDAAAAGGFVNGDKVSAKFTSNIESYLPSSNCIEGPASAPVTIQVNDIIAATPTDQSTTICLNGAATFTAPVTTTGPATVTYTWTVGTRTYTTNTASLDIPAEITGTAGSYPVSVVVSNSCETTSTLALGTLTVKKALTQFTVSGDNNYCASTTGTLPVKLSGSEVGVNYTLWRDGNWEQTKAGTGEALVFAVPNEAGVYRVRAAYTTAPLCIVDMNGSATITENPLPLVVTATGGSYCAPLSGESATGTTISIGSSQSGVSYQLVNGSGQNVGSAIGGTGGALAFGPVLAGSYNVVATNNTTGCPNVVAENVQVTETARVVPTGDIIITNESGVVIQPNQLETGKYARFTAATTFGDDNNALTYTWYTGDGTEANWVKVDGVEGPVYTVQSVPGGMFSVKVVVTADTNACYTVFDGTYSTQAVEPLPVEIIYLTASKQGNNVLLEWATAMEKDNKGFEVQVSKDGLNYRLLTFVPSKNGNTNTKQVYAFTDQENGKNGTRYYRLKQIDNAGTFEFFGPKMVTFGSVASKVIAFPNPFNDEITLDIASETDGEMLIEVNDAVGKQLMQRKVRVEKGFTTEKLKLGAGLPRGLYIIKTQIGGYTQFIKMVKE